MNKISSFIVQLKASLIVSGSFLFNVSGNVHSQIAEVNDSAAKMMSGSDGEMCCDKIGVRGVIMLPTRPMTEQMLKNRWRMFVGKSSIVKMYRHEKDTVIVIFPNTKNIVFSMSP